MPAGTYRRCGVGDVVFSTGQIAKRMNVAPRTISKLFDAGKIVGYRIPGSRDRRVPRENLIRFFKENGFPLGDLAEDGPRLVVLASPTVLEWFDAPDEVVVAPDEFGLGLAVAERKPTLVVLDTSFGADNCDRVAERVREKLGGDAEVWALGWPDDPVAFGRASRVHRRGDSDPKAWAASARERALLLAEKGRGEPS